MVSIQVTESLSGQLLCELLPKEDWPVKQLQRAIAANTDIPVPEQRLLWKGGVLRFGDTVSVLVGALDDPQSPVVVKLRLIRVEPSWHRLLDSFIRNGPMLTIDKSIKVDDAMMSLLSKRSFAMAAVQEDGMVLGLLSPELQADREVVLIAVRVDGSSLHYAAEVLQGDAELVMVAVMQNGLALRSASRSLQDDRSIVLAAVQENGDALQYASFDQREDRELCLRAIKSNGVALEHAAVHLQEERDFVVEAVQLNADAFYHVRSVLRLLPDIVSAARGCPLQEAHPRPHGLSTARRAAPFVGVHA
mmetsp:Transcript_5605/g.9688  ORF Transcript_5605/g.9688 Transcript_5605/m.9688 type:complete len:305 (-) Transcript_5605:14-928(-)